MQILELYFQFAGVTLLLVQLVLIVRDAWDVRPARFGALLVISLIYIVGADASAAAYIPGWLHYGLSALSMNTAIFIWWFALSLFDDEFRLRRLEWAVAIVWFILGVFNFNEFIFDLPISAPWAAYTRSVMALGIVAHIVYRALAGRQTDLIEGRRRVRVLFAFAIAALFLVDIGSELTFGWHEEPLWFSTIEHGLFFAVILWGCFWLLRLDKHALMFDPVAESAEAPRQALSPKEQLLHQKLIGVVEAEKAFLEPELSISALAARIGAPEHQLRTLINKAMGHRNFRAFLNGYRMAAAKAALADPQKAALPILTIAMDAGFASLSSFNRAFKESNGQTPTAFRQAALGGNTPSQN
jgi:AraC-like DNA-binding protein